MLGWASCRAHKAPGKEQTTEPSPAAMAGKVGQCCSCSRKWGCFLVAFVQWSQDSVGMSRG